MYPCSVPVIIQSMNRKTVSYRSFFLPLCQSILFDTLLKL